MIAACEIHHLSCSCREHKIAVLIKAALDAATTLDEAQTAADIDAESKAAIKGLVERLYNACEMLGAVIGGEESETTVRQEEEAHL